MNDKYNELELLNNIFKLKVASPKSALSDYYKNKMPKVNLKILKKGDCTNSQLIEELKLNPEIRVPIIDSLEIDRENILTNERNREFFTVFIIQSFFYILLTDDLDDIEESILMHYAGSLHFATNICTKYKTFIKQILLLFTDKIITSRHLIISVPVIDSIIVNLPNADCFANYFIKTFHYILSKPLLSDKIVVISHLTVVSSVIQAMQIPDELYPLINSSIDLVINYFKAGKEISLTLYMCLWVAFELQLYINGPLEDIDSVIKKFILEKPFFVPEEREVEYTRKSTDFKLISVEDALNLINKDFFMIYKSFSGFDLNVIKHLFDRYANLVTEHSDSTAMFILILCSNMKSSIDISFKGVDAYNVFFNSNIFESPYSVFEEEINPIVVIRKYILSTFAECAKKCTSIKPSYLTFISQLTTNSPLFSEVLLFSKNIFPLIQNESHASVFSDCLSQQFLIQEKVTDDNRFTSLIFKSVLETVDVKNLRVQMMENNFILEIVIKNIINEESCERTLEKLLTIMINDFTNNENVQDYQLFLGIIKEFSSKGIEYSRVLINNLGNIAKESSLECFVYTHYFQEFIDICGMHNDSVLVFKILTLLAESTKPYDLSKINFDKLLGSIELDDDLYKIMKYHICQNDTNDRNIDAPFTGIWNGRTYAFIQKIVSSPFLTAFLEEMNTITSESIVQCYECIKHKFVECLLDFVPEIEKEENITLLLSVFSNISKHFSSRPILFSYFRLFKVDNEKRIKFAEKLIDCFATTIAGSNDSVNDILQFRKGKGKIVIPAFKINPSGFTINIFANICCLHSDVNFIVFNKNDKPFAKLILGDKSVSFDCLDNKKTADMEFDTNNWHNITIAFVQASFTLYVDGEFKKLFKVPLSFAHDSFSSIELFNDEMSGLCYDVSVFNVAADDSLLNDITNDTIEFNLIRKHPNLTMLYTAKHIKNDCLMNIINNATECAVTTCESSSFVASFRRIFENSKGLQYFVTLFSQTNFLNYEGKKDNAFSHVLLDALKLILEVSEVAQKILTSINGFGVICYFLYQIDIKDPTIFDHIYPLETVIKNDELMKQFQVSLLLNHILWEHENGSIKDFLTCCQRSLTSTPKVFHSIMTFSSLISLFYTFEDSNELSDFHYKTFQNLLIESAKDNFDEQSLASLQELIVHNEQKEESVYPLLNVLMDVALRDESIWDSIIQVELNQLHSSYIHASIIAHLPKEFLSSSLFTLLNYYKSQNEEDQNSIFAHFAEKAKKECNTILAVFSIAFALINTSKEVEAIEIANLCLGNNDVTKLDATSFAVIILFFVFASPNNVETLAKFISNDMNSINNCFQLIMLISDASSIDLHFFTSKLLSKLIEMVFTDNENQNRKEFFEYAVTIIFMNINHSAIIEHNFKPLERVDLNEFLQLLSSYSTKNISFEYGISTDNENSWLDDSNAMLLLHYAQNEFGANAFESIFYMCLMSAVFSRNITKEKNNFLKNSLNDAIKSKFSAPLIVNVYSNIESFDFPTIKSLRASTPDDAFEVMQEFYEQLIKFEQIHFVFSFNAKCDKESSISKTLPQIIAQMKKYSLDALNIYKRDWHRLWRGVSYQRSPFLSSVMDGMEQHYKIGTHYDHHLTPILMVKNNNFDKHSEASVKRGGITKEEFEEIMNQDAIKKSSNARFFMNEDDKVDETNYKVGKYLWSCTCEKIRILSKVPGVFYVTDEGYIFVSDKKTNIIKCDNVKYVFWSWTSQKPESIQIFTTNYKGYYFRFPGQPNHKFVQNLKLCPLPNCQFFQESPPHEEIEHLGLTSKWVKRQISNYDYLIWLNLLSGRSFSDSRIYPIMPLIIKDMDTDTLKQDSNCIRDITQNVVMMNPNAKRILDEKAEVLELDPNSELCYFPSLYSNAYVVSHYFIRMEPYTTLHIILQDGHFDVASRLFISLSDMINRLMGNVITAKELTPEFYSIPEFLTNIDGFKFGQLSDTGEYLNNVGLPNWAESPADFINKQRSVLESEYVSNMLSGWIDLIWGYKVVGDEANEAYNSYDSFIYPNVWKKESEFISDQAKMAMMNTIGQVPQLLFSAPHPKRNPIVQAPPQTHAVVLCNIPESIASIICTGSSFDQMKACAILHSGRVFCLRLAAPNFEIQMQRTIALPEDRRKIVAVEKCDGDDIDNIRVVFAQDKRANVSVLNLNTRTVIQSKTTPHLAEITCISACNDYILSGGTDACASLWHYDNETVEPINFILAHRAEITCCYLSDMFGIAATVSSDFTAVITRLPEFDFLRAIDLVMPDLQPESEHTVYSPPSSIVVTNELGYIIVFFDEYVESFTLNGTFITLKKLGRKCIKSYLVQPYVGVEYVVALLDNNQVVLMDQFSLKPIKSIWKGTDKIIDIGYHKDLMNFVLTTNTPNVILVPAVFA